MQPIEFWKQPVEMMATAVENFRSESPSLHDKDESEGSGKTVILGEIEITRIHVSPGAVAE